jgi:hypothetical protein
MLISAVLLASATIFGIKAGDSAQAAMERLRGAGMTIRRYDSSGPLETFWISSTSNEVIGSLGTCKGLIYSVHSDAGQFDNFVRLLRARTDQLGSPKLSFKNVPVVNSSRNFDQMVFTWPAANYQMELMLDTKPFGSQSSTVEGAVCRN